MIKQVFEEGDIVRIINVNGRTDEPRVGCISKVLCANSERIKIDISQPLLKDGSDWWFTSELEIIKPKMDDREIFIQEFAKQDKKYQLCPNCSSDDGILEYVDGLMCWFCKCCRKQYNQEENKK